MYNHKMYNKKLVLAIRKLAGNANEAIPDEAIAESLSYEQIMDLERDILLNGGPSFKDHFVEVYNELTRKAKLERKTA